jgi:hypothetical protein
MDENTKLKLGLFAVLLIGFIVALFSMNEHDNQVVHTTKVDSLNQVIDSLQTEYKILEDGCDIRESRYEDALSEYQWGLSYLEDYHPAAYKDFHRIIGMKERYSKKLDRENKQRLNINE